MSIITELGRSFLWPADMVREVKNSTLDMVRTKAPYHKLKDVPLRLRDKAKKTLDNLWQPLPPFDRASPVWSGVIFGSTLAIVRTLGYGLSPEHKALGVAALYAAGMVASLRPVDMIGNFITAGAFNQIRVGLSGAIIGLATS